MAADVESAVKSRRRNRLLATMTAGLFLVAVAGSLFLRSDDQAADVDTLAAPISTTTPTTTTSSTILDVPLELSGEGSAAADIAGPLASWRANPISEYYLRIEPKCFCDTRPYLVQVVHGVALAAISETDASPHPALTDEGSWTPATVEELYELLRSYSQGSLSGGPDPSDGTYVFSLDDSGRWPTRIALDPIINAIDDELSLDITLLTERPAAFTTETVNVLVSTAHILPGTPVEGLLESVAVTGVPEEFRPASALTQSELAALDGWVARQEISYNQVIVRDLFVDPAALLGFPEIPAGFVLFSLLHELEFGLKIGDAVEVTADGASVDATIVAIGRNPGIVTLLLANTDAQTLAAPGAAITIGRR